MVRSQQKGRRDRSRRRRSEDSAAIKQVQCHVEKIWLTHGHIDHVGGAAELRDALKVPIDRARISPTSSCSTMWCRAAPASA
jgi:phosphoribosyl 1,2-cyclic phosphodiesterase